MAPASPDRLDTIPPAGEGGGITVDRPAHGVVIAQPARGFRYGADAFWLTGFALQALARASIRAGGATALDLGAGSGIVGALLAARGLRVRGVDLREEWTALWDLSLAESRLAGTLELAHGDLLAERGPVDLVVSNPPFFARGSGPVAPDPWKAAARTESTATLAQVVGVAARALGPGGVACVIVPVDRADEVCQAAAASGLGVARQVTVGARRWLAALRQGATEAPMETIDDHGDATALWYRLARGEPT